MLLDEPFSALDAALRENMRNQWPRLLGAAGIAAVLVTHDQAEALSFADQLAVMRDGRLAQVGPPHELYLRPRDRDTAAFLGEAIVLEAQVGEGWAECGIGRIAVNSAGRRGAAEIMLRPEQLQLTPAVCGQPTTDADGLAGYGRVVEVVYGGAACTVAVSVLGDADRDRAATADRRQASICLRSARACGSMCSARPTSSDAHSLGEATSSRRTWRVSSACLPACSKLTVTRTPTADCT